MRHFWRSLAGTFLSGLFAILPVVITVAIVSWVAQQIYDLVGPGTRVGGALRSIGMQFFQQEAAAPVVGGVVVIVGIWLLGLLVRTKARNAIEGTLNGIANRIPFVKGIYGTAHQVIGMLNRKEGAEFASMDPVFCGFGVGHGAGFLGLLASPETFLFHDREYRVVYVPTSPLPMSGGIIFVPTESVKRVEMSADQLMQIYLSLGVLAPQVVPDQYRVKQAITERDATP